MALTGVHFLLTYRCTYECDHCFVFSSPRAEAVFTGEGLSEVLEQAAAIGSVEWVFFEGGEPFLYYPLLQYAVARTAELGFRVGIVTNAYWATTVDDAARALEGLARVDLLSASRDSYHGDGPGPRHAVAAAERLGIEHSTISIEGSDVMYRGRAVEKLVHGLPRRAASEFRECPHEPLEAPARVHVDPYGLVHVCQGITIGNVFDAPLAAILDSYDPAAHPIVGPLLRGGPCELARDLGFDASGGGFVDACHLCYAARKTAHLGPDVVYGR
ncbi:MAG: radical SAM protein [Planctomycetota bacterium]